MKLLIAGTQDNPEVTKITDKVTSTFSKVGINTNNAGRKIVAIGVTA
jgi:hypothetical protein